MASVVDHSEREEWGKGAYRGGLMLLLLGVVGEEAAAVEEGVGGAGRAGAGSPERGARVQGRRRDWIEVGED